MMVLFGAYVLLFAGVNRSRLDALLCVRTVAGAWHIYEILYKI